MKGASNEKANGKRGVLVYAAVVLTGVLVVAAIFPGLNLSVSDKRAGALIMAAMWMPTLARIGATRTVDRGWRAPLPLRRWGRPRLAVVLVPLAVVSAIYLGAYLLAWLGGVEREPPVWKGTAMVLNIIVNLPLLAAIGVIGGLGEEFGWRGYLQPRLDQIGISQSLLWVIALEVAFHVPLILLAGYFAGQAWGTSIALFLALKLGATPLWTWATYKWGTLWMAAWFHAFHNAISQTLLPKAFGAGNPLILGESGALPVALYLGAAGIVFGIEYARGQGWGALARRAVGEPDLDVGHIIVERP